MLKERRRIAYATTHKRYVVLFGKCKRAHLNSLSLSHTQVSSHLHPSSSRSVWLSWVLSSVSNCIRSILPSRAPRAYLPIIVYARYHRATWTESRCCARFLRRLSRSTPLFFLFSMAFILPLFIYFFYDFYSYFVGFFKPRTQKTEAIRLINESDLIM